LTEHTGVIYNILLSGAWRSSDWLVPYPQQPECIGQETCTVYLILSIPEWKLILHSGGHQVSVCPQWSWCSFTVVGKTDQDVLYSTVI